VSHLLKIAQQLFDESYSLPKIVDEENSAIVSDDDNNSDDRDNSDDDRNDNEGCEMQTERNDTNYKNENNKNFKKGKSESKNQTYRSFNPLVASYYLASNMPLQDRERQQLLESENIIIRLKSLISMLQRYSNGSIACSYCNQTLASKKQMFKVPGAEGLVGAYVNSMG
jgi:ATP-dependent Lon protease